MNIYETTTDYSRAQTLYLILVSDNNKGYTGFCVDTKNNMGNKIVAGDLVSSIPTDNVKISKYNIDNSPLHDNYLLSYYIKKCGDLY